MKQSKENNQISLKDRTESYRVSIRERMVQKTFSNLRAQVFQNINVSQSDYLNIINKLNSTNLLEHLDSIKYISLNREQLNNFVPYFNQFVKLAEATNDDYVFDSCMQILINMCLCENLNLNQIKINSLINQLNHKNKEENLLWLFGNLLQFKNQQLCKDLLKANIFDYISKRISRGFDSQESLTVFNIVLTGLICNSQSMSIQQLQDLLKHLKTIESYKNEETIFQLYCSLSHLKYDINNIEKVAVLLQYLKEGMMSVFKNKKSKSILCLLHFFYYLSKNPENFELFVKYELFQMLNIALQNRHPEIRPLIIYILSNMTNNSSSIIKIEVYLTIFNSIKDFSSQKEPIKYSLIELIKSTLISTQDLEWLKVFYNFGILNHIKLMLTNQDIQLLHSALDLLQIVLELDENAVNYCQSINIHQDLFHLQSHPSQEIYEKTYKLIEKYFAVRQ